MSVEDQVIVIYALTNGFLDDIEVKDILKFESQYIEYIRSSHPEIIEEIKNKKDIDEKLSNNLDKAISRFKEGFAT